MDRIDAMKVFIAVVDEASLLGASRRLRRSPAAVSRAIGYLEAHVGTTLLHRTTRSLKLSHAGERYATACRKIMDDLRDAELAAAEETHIPRGSLTIAAPTAVGEDILRIILAEFMDQYPDIRINLVLADHPVNLTSEGIDVALCVGRLADSNFVGLRLGEVRKILSASPHYLARHPQINELADLSKHQIIALTEFGLNAWEFRMTSGSKVPRFVNFCPRLVVNTARAAVASAVDGQGITRLFCFDVESYVRNGSLLVLLAARERTAVPVHLVTSKSRLALPKVRVLIDFVAPRLKAYFGGVKVEIERHIFRNILRVNVGKVVARIGDRLLELLSRNMGITQRVLAL